MVSLTNMFDEALIYEGIQNDPRGHRKKYRKQLDELRAFRNEKVDLLGRAHELTWWSRPIMAFRLNRMIRRANKEIVEAERYLRLACKITPHNKVCVPKKFYDNDLTFDGYTVFIQAVGQHLANDTDKIVSREDVELWLSIDVEESNRIMTSLTDDINAIADIEDNARRNRNIVFLQKQLSGALQNISIRNEECAKQDELEDEARQAGIKAMIRCL